jgi:hypothetical protein
MDFPIKVIDNFLSDSEIQTIEQLSNEFATHEDKHPGVHDVLIKPFYPYTNSIIAEIILPKIKKEFGDVYIDTAHILESFIPYGVHNDIASAGFDPLVESTSIPAWTFIIPLDDYESHTVVFNESDLVYKTMEPWIAARNVLPHGQPVDKKFHEKYLSHVDLNDLNYLTLKYVFAWKKGSMFAAARSNFHTSDNFPANGLTSKRGIIMWTTVDKNYQCNF